MKLVFPVSFRTLRAKLLWLLLVLFVVLIGQAAVKALQGFDTLKAEKKQQFQITARWIESEQHRHIAQARMVAFMAINEMRKGLDGKVCSQGVVGYAGLDPEFGRFAIADLQGNVSCNSIPWLTDKNIARQQYFQQALQQSDLGIVGRAHNGSPAHYAAIMARALRDKAGRAQKVVLVEMDFSWIQEELDAIELPASGHLLLLDQNGVVIAATANAASAVGTSIAATAFHARIVSMKDSVYDGPGFKGAASFVAAHQFNTGSGLMRLVIDIPHDVLLQPAYTSLFETFVSSLLIFLLAMWLVYFGSEKYFLSKVRLLDQANKRFAEGDRDFRVGLAGQDELSRLSRSFDAMADSIQAHEAEIKVKNEELGRVNRALRVLSAGNRSLLFAKTEQELLERICHDIVEEGGYLAAWIGFAGPEGDKYLRMAAAYSKSENETHRIDWNHAGNGLEPVINAVRDDRIMVINDTEREAVHHHLGAQAAKFGYRSVVILPLHLEGKPFGALILCACDANEFGSVQVNYLKETALDTSFGIEMLRTKGERNRLALLGEHYEQSLRDSLEDALRAIALTIEMRDPYTAGHQRRVADLAYALAKELGIDSDLAHGIYLAAIVHDIGKINVPAEILVKPGKLSDIEYALVKHHVVSSYEILQGIKFPWPVATMVHQHHERIDGSGYPLSLQDGEIEFGARILAVADVVEAMSSHRPYRPGLGIDAALAEIEKGKATHYDAAVVDACLKLFRENRFQF
ncbi:MAG: HD domain-containing protein [Gammaproteobacteria bacterium]|nr:HD domain-containing protein [Gammaproteobacteria bacterium]MBU1624230.1 HD domain-containing protein [Gammaproteobacteria bacterium]MBU1981958.1 HD domain-containing protein [Gammaproteobacteria bacterium]